MREIKFRAWSKKRKQMYYATYDQGYFESNGSWWQISIDEGKVRASSIYGDILMQYIGRKDKKGNGQEIYEGDVLSFDGNMTADNSMGLDPNGFIYDENSKHVVIWNQELAAWEPKFKEGEHWKYKRDTRGLMVRGDCEIIGNIHDNPELIEGGAYGKDK